MTTLPIQKVDNGVIFRVKIVPGSSSPTRICGLLGDMLKIKVAAAPEKGEANRCLIDFLSQKLGVKKNAVSIISGSASPVKRIQVLGMSVDTLLRKLNLNKLNYSQ